MIPYDDLVGALQNWRAKQGLPVAGLAVAPTPGSGRTAAPPPAPEPAYAVDESLEVDEALVEEHDYGAVEQHGDDETAIGAAPQRGDYDENPTELASDSGHLRNQREDW
jgi:hypothetical protein